jgi:predicted dehydrogenase
VALYDPLRERAEKLAAEHGIAKVYTSAEEMLAKEKLDVVSICAPNAFHAPLAIAALQAGAHVLTEKPMALNYKDAQAMLAAAKKAGRQISVCFNNRYRPVVQLLKQYSQEKHFGNIYFARATYWRRTGIPGYGSWFTNKDQSGGGAMLDIGVHYLDMSLHIMGHPKPVSVTASSYAEFGPRGLGLGGWGSDILPPPQRCDVEDLVSTTVRFENGATLGLEVSWAAYVKQGERLQFMGTEMGADLYPTLYGDEKPLRLFADIDKQPVETIPDIPRAPQTPTHALLIQEWIKNLDKPEAPVPGWQGAMTAQIIEATYRSAETGKSVML